LILQIFEKLSSSKNAWISCSAMIWVLVGTLYFTEVFYIVLDLWKVQNTFAHGNYIALLYNLKAPNPTEVCWTTG
jgi:hypothetical protein